MSGGLPVAIFVFAMTIVYGLGIAATGSFFAGTRVLGFDVLSSAVGHAIANVLAMGPILALVDRIIVRFSDEEVGRRGPLALRSSRGSLP